MNKKNEKKNEEKKESNAEKPVSLWGASFKDVVKALLNTEPVTKEDEEERKTEKAQ